MNKFYSVKGALRGLKICLFIIVGWLGWLSGYMHGLLYLDDLMNDVSVTTRDADSAQMSNAMPLPIACARCTDDEPLSIVASIPEAP